MEIALQLALLVVGFVLLIKGADWLVDGASSVASSFKVSKLLIGLTIVAFGTGAPELAVSFSSLISGNTDILIGNVVGSNIINVLLLIGIAAVIRPIKVKKATVSKELPLLLLISTALIVLLLDTNLAEAVTNTFSRADAIICLLFFGVFLYYLISLARKNKKEAKKVEKPKYKLGKSFFLVVLGLACVVAGSELVVNSASFVAAAMGISERIISLTIVAGIAQMAVSRQREYLADASAAHITRYPEGMIDALKKLQVHSTPMKSQNIAAEAMYINNPLRKGFFNNLFSSHPPIEKRIERLENGKKKF